MIAIKEEHDLSALESSGVVEDEDDDENINDELENDGLPDNDQDDEDGDDENAEDDDEQNQGIFMSDEHQYIETIHEEPENHEMIEESEIEVRETYWDLHTDTYTLTLT